jgi:hypothetical protein
MKQTKTVRYNINSIIMNKGYKIIILDVREACVVFFFDKITKSKLVHLIVTTDKENQSTVVNTA